MPVLALLGASYPRFFRRGAKGIDAAREYARQLLPAVVGLAIVCGAVLLAGAPLMPALLGSQYGAGKIMIWSLAAYPVLRGLQYLTGDILTGIGEQAQRARYELETSGLNVALNIALIPIVGWLGAATATLVSEVTLWLRLHLWVKAEAELADEQKASKYASRP